MIKNPPANAGAQETRVQSLGWEDLLEKEMQPTPVFLPGESHGQRSPANLFRQAESSSEFKSKGSQLCAGCFWIIKSL